MESFKAFLRKTMVSDLRSLALMRILIGYGLVFDTIYRMTDIKSHYSDDGVLPTFEAKKILAQYDWFSFHVLSGELWYQYSLFGVLLALAFCLLIGFKTKVVTPLAWLFFLSTQNRFFLPNYPGDYIMSIALFWGCFLPWQARFSVDALKSKKYRDMSSQYLGFASVAFFLQAAVFFFAAGLSKIAAGGTWFDGTGVYYVLNCIRFYTGYLTGITEYPWLVEFATYSTPWTEVIVPILLFSPFCHGPLRSLAIFIICTYLLSFNLGLNIHQLGILGIFLYLGMLPAWFWDKSAILMSRLRGKKPPQIDPSKGLSHFPDWVSSPLARVAVNITVVVFFVGVMHHYTIKMAKYYSPDVKPIYALDYPIRALRLNNIFRMFSDPSVFLTRDGWDVAPGRLRSGKMINVYNGKDLSFERPESLNELLGGFRWRRYITTINWRPFWNKRHISNYKKVEGEKLRWYLARYLCRRWNNSHLGDETLEEFKITLMTQKMNLYAPKDPPQRIDMGSYQCGQIENVASYNDFLKQQKDKSLNAKF